MSWNNFTKRKFAVTVNNCNTEISEYPYIIVRYADGGLWYYGAYTDYAPARAIAESLGNGFVIENTPVE